MEEDVEDHISFEELTSSDYGSDDYMYESKARARLACKAAINEMLLTVKTELITGAKSYLICSEEFCSALRSSFDEFVSDLSNAYDSYAVECSESLEAYIMSRKKEMFSVINPKKGGSTVSGSEIEKSISAAIDKILSARQLARKCDYDNDDDGDYCFCLDGACDDINQEVAGFVSGLENELPARIETECKNAILRQLQILNGKFDDIFAE